MPIFVYQIIFPLLLNKNATYIKEIIANNVFQSIYQKKKCFTGYNTLFAVISFTFRNFVYKKA